LLAGGEYADFILRLEFNLDKDSGAGIALRARPAERVPLGEAHIFDHRCSSLRNSGKEETGTTQLDPQQYVCKSGRSAEMAPAGSWNRLEIEMQGHTMRALVNGQFIDPLPWLPAPSFRTDGPCLNA